LVQVGEKHDACQKLDQQNQWNTDHCDNQQIGSYFMHFVLVLCFSSAPIQHALPEYNITFGSGIIRFHWLAIGAQDRPNPLFC